MASDSFWSLAEKADKKFTRLRDLPPCGRGKWDSYYNKAFQIYTKLWKYQQENRQALVDAGLKRWEIGEIASRIGQLYYSYYIRTSDVAFLSESYVFFEATMTREYFKDTAKDALLLNKHLRFYVRFIVVCMLLNRREMVVQISRQFRSLVEEHYRTFQGNDSKEWKRVLQDLNKFIKAEAPFQNSRPLRYSILLDQDPSSFSKSGDIKPLYLKDAVLASCYHNEVKFSELTLDTFRFLQCLEWEPSGSFYRPRATDSNGAMSGQSGTMRVDNIMDQSLPPNPHKYVLYRPSVLQLLHIMATACEDLPADGIILLYLAASGKAGRSSSRGVSLLSPILSVSKLSLHSDVTHSDDTSPLEHSGRTEDVTLDGNETSPSSSPDHVASSTSALGAGDPTSQDAGLWFGSQGTTGSSYLYPADILPFTRRPLFIVIDSDKSSAFDAICGEERGEPAALLLSPTIVPSQKRGDFLFYHQRGAGGFFTFFLTAPLLAFCQLVNVPYLKLAQSTVEQLQKLLTLSIIELANILSATALDPVWLRIMSDPFLRQLLLRFIFCRACLSLHRDCRNKPECLPRCLPPLPKELLPSEVAVESCVFQTASSLGVAEQFSFSSSNLQLQSWT